MNLNRCILNAGERMFACRQTHSTQPCFSSLFCPSQLPKTQTPAHVDTLPHDNTGFRGKLYKVPLGCSLHCERWSHSTEHQPREALCYGSRPLPRTQFHESHTLEWGLQAILETSVQVGNPVLMGNVFFLSQYQSRSFTTPVLHWEGSRTCLAGWDRCHKYLGRL